MSGAAGDGSGLGRGGRWIVVSLPYLWLLALFLAPFLIVLKISFAESILAQPPYTALLAWIGEAGRKTLAFKATLANYQLLLSDDLYLRAYLNSLRIAATATVLTLLIALPMAYGLARAPHRLRPYLLAAAILPFWTSFLIRVYAWIGILKPEGLLNQALQALGIIDRPLVLLNTETAVLIGITYSYLPFMLLPLYASLEKLDYTLLEAAADLGCRPVRAFWSITMPLAFPGVIAGVLLVFIPAVGEFVIPDLLGGSDTLMIGKTLWVEFFNNRDWPLASAAAVLLVILLVLPLTLLQQRQSATIDPAA